MQESRVAFVLKGYPRLSETFIAQEIHALEQRGLCIDLISLRHPTDRTTHPIHARIRASCLYLPEYLYQEPLRVLRAWWRARRRETYRSVRKTWLRDLWRDRTPNRIRRFGQALVLAEELAEGTTQLHAHFLHTPASVTRYAALLLRKPWTVSAHAKDIWTSPTWEKAEKLACCEWAVTCTASNAEHLASLAPAGRVSLLYHGLDQTIFPPAPARQSVRDGSGEAVRILSVGRAVEKKGYGDLLEALARLNPGRAWRFEHIGGGNGLERLRAHAEQLGIADRITWRGALSQPDVMAAYQSADIFVLASKIAVDGDRDGLPNVLMEAQSQGVGCVATAVSAIPELISDGETGLLVPPGDVDALAKAVDTLMSDPSLRNRLAQAGQQRVATQFSADQGADWLAAKFRDSSPNAQSD